MSSHDLLAQIEKRRRQLQFLTYVLMIILAAAIVGLLFFIDRFAGFVASLRYNSFLRFYFIVFVLGFILYLAEKERQQYRMTGDVMRSLERTSLELEKQLRQDQFLHQISHLLADLKDSSTLDQFFKVAKRFLAASGGAMVLIEKKRAVGTPFGARQMDNAKVALEIAARVAQTGKTFMSPEPNYPKRQLSQQVGAAIGVPLRLEGTLYGVLTFWRDQDVPFDEHDEDLLELISRQATASAVQIKTVHNREKQFSALVNMLADMTDQLTGKKKGQSLKVSALAASVAQALKLPDNTVHQVETAAALLDVGQLAKRRATKDTAHKRAAGSAEVLAKFNFPKSLTDLVLHQAEPFGAGTAPVAARIIHAADFFVSATTANGSKPMTKAAALRELTDKAGGEFDPTVVRALTDILKKK